MQRLQPDCAKDNTSTDETTLAEGKALALCSPTLMSLPRCSQQFRKETWTGHVPGGEDKRCARQVEGAAESGF